MADASRSTPALRLTARNFLVVFDSFCCPRPDQSAPSATAARANVSAVPTRPLNERFLALECLTQTFRFCERAAELEYTAFDAPRLLQLLTDVLEEVIMQSKIYRMLAICVALAITAATSIATAATLAAMQSRGYVKCGVNTGLPGFSAPDENGNWSGIDVAFCRAVAAAVLGDAQPVRFTPLTAKERFTALQ